MPSTWDATRDFLRRAVAETRSGLKRSYERASEPGPAIRISPFEAGGVSTGAALLKLATSVFSDARARANERRKMELETANQETTNLRRDLLTQQIAKLRTENAAPPEETHSVTISPQGDLVDPTVTGPPEPGTTTYGGLSSNEALTRIASIRSGERADERLDVSEGHLGVARERLALSEESGRRAEESLKLAREREGRAREYHAARRLKMLEPDPLKRLPMENANLDELREGVAYGDREQSDLDAAEKNIYLAMIRDGRAAKQSEDFARALLTNPAMLADPDLYDSVVQALGAAQAGPFMTAYIKAAQDTRARAQAEAERRGNRR